MNVNIISAIKCCRITSKIDIFKMPINLILAILSCLRDVFINYEYNIGPSYFIAALLVD